MNPTTLTAPPLPSDVEALLRTLRLPHARAIAADVLATARTQRWDPTEVVKTLLTEETAGRARSMLATRRKAAGFPTGKTFDAWDPTASSIPLPTQQALQTLEWVSRRENLVICGPAGTGKTFFLEALGQKVIEAGMPVAWFTLEGIDPVNADVGQASTQGGRPSPGRGGSPIPAAVDRESRQRWSLVEAR